MDLEISSIEKGIGPSIFYFHFSNMKYTFYFKGAYISNKGERWLLGNVPQSYKTQVRYSSIYFGLHILKSTD